MCRNTLIRNMPDSPSRGIHNQRLRFQLLLGSSDAAELTSCQTFLATCPSTEAPPVPPPSTSADLDTPDALECGD